MSHITGAAVAKAFEAPEELRVLWVGLCYRSAVCAVSRGLGCLFWNGAIRCDWRPSSFFIAGGIRECPFYVPLGLKWWAVSTVCKNEKGESVEGSAHGYTRFPGGLLCASVNVVYRHALHKPVAFCFSFFLKTWASQTETSHNALLLSNNLLASEMFQTGVWEFHSFPAPLSPIKYVSYFFCKHRNQSAWVTIGLHTQKCKLNIVAHAN